MKYFLQPGLAMVLLELFRPGPKPSLLERWSGPRWDPAYSLLACVEMALTQHFPTLPPGFLLRRKLFFSSAGLPPFHWSFKCKQEVHLGDGERIRKCLVLAKEHDVHMLYASAARVNNFIFISNDFPLPLSHTRKISHSTNILHEEMQSHSTISLFEDIY